MRSSRIVSSLALAAALAAATFLSAGRASAADVLLDRATNLGSWSAYLGWEFPGATGTVSVVKDAERGACVEGKFNFAGQSRYAGPYWSGDIPAAKAIGFWVKLADRDGGGLRLRDSEGQEHAGSFTAQRGKWTRVEVPITPARFSSHWGGSNDGKFRFPITNVLISVNAGPASGSLRVSDLYVVESKVTPADRCRLSIEPDLPMGIAFRGEKATYQVRVLNRLSDPLDASVRVETQATALAASRKVAFTKEVHLAGWQEASLPLPLPTDQYGYRCVRAQVRAPGAGGAGSAQLADAVSAIAVVPRPRFYGKSARDCYFGLQDISNMEAAERLGAKSVRFAPGWRWGEPTQGHILFKTYFDPDVDAALQHHMQILMTLQSIPPAYAAWKVAGKPKLDSLPDPAKLNLWTDYCREMASHYRGDFRAIEIQNEPDLTCSWAVGLPKAQGVDYYCKLLKAGYEGVKAGDPNCLVAGCDVSGGDFDGGLPFTKAVLDKAAKYVELYTAHPYSGVRYFGPGQKPLWPVQNTLNKRCEAALKLLADHGKKPRMWIGELGWGLLNTADPLSSYSDDFAACVAQALLLGKSVKGVDKFLWFTLEGCNEHGYEYGLCRGQPTYPLPAAMAYATAAYLLEPSQPAAPAVSRGDLWRASFVCQPRKQLIVAYFSAGDDLRITPPADAPAGRWYDSSMATLHPGPGGLLVTRMPIYWVLPLDKVGERPSFLDHVAMRASVPVRTDKVYARDLGHLGLLLTNKAGTAQRVRVTVEGKTQSLTLPLDARLQAVAVPLATRLTVGPELSLPVTVAAGGVKQTSTLKARLTALPAPPASFKADGNLSEWAGLPSFDLRDRADILPADPGIGWNGPQDLSMRAWLAADSKGLYFAADVTDDIHHAPVADANSFWNYDSIQLAIDPLNDSVTAFNSTDREVGFILGPQGPRAFRSYPSPRVRLDVPIGITRAGTHTRYEVFMPWSALGIAAPRPGQVMAIDFIANDNDGQGRGYWIGLTPGIGEGKTPTSYRQFAVMVGR